MITAAQDLTAIKEEEDTYDGTKNNITQDEPDESDIVVPMREPITGQAAS